MHDNYTSCVSKKFTPVAVVITMWNETMWNENQFK